MKKTRDDQQPQQQPQLFPYYHLSQRIHMTPWSWQGQGFRPHRTQCHAGPSPRRRDPEKLGWWSRRCNWPGGCRTSTVDSCLCVEQRARSDLKGWPRASYLTVDWSGVIWTLLEQTLGTSGEPLFSETGWFSSRSPSTICLIPVADQFPAFVSDHPSSPLNSTIEEEEEEEKDDGMLSFRTVATHFLDASVGIITISTLLGPDAQWSTKDIDQSPRHPLGCCAPRPPTEEAITT